MSRDSTSWEEIMVAREHLGEWITKERAEYADADKYDPDGATFRRLSLDIKDFGVTDGGEMLSFIGNYLKRAQLMGVENANGRQALGKCIVTMMAALEHAIVHFGEMPEPGVPSGEVKVWYRGD